MNPLTQFKKIRILSLLIAPVLLALISPVVSRADAVTDWNLIASTAIVTTAGQPPPVSALSFAMVQGAVYDAVNAIDRGHQPYLVQPASNPTDSKEAATATAAFRVLVGFDDLPGLFPAQQPTLQPQYDAYIAALPDSPPGSRAAGVTIGEATARAMLTARLNDGRFGPSPTPYPQAPGIWRPTPPNFLNDPAPWVGNVRPFLVPSAEMLRTDGPNALTSAAYTEDFNEVKELGSLYSTTRTADQTDAAIFWQDHAHALFTPPFPDHPSGHACATGAFVNTLQNFFGTDKISFSAFSNKSCTTRSFERFSDALKEVIDARVWAGIHFRTADTQGAVLGKKVAQYLKKNYFQPVR